MAFPDAAVLLDEFTGSGALSGNWTAFYNSHVRAAGKMVGSTSEDANVSYWSASQFGPDCEAYITFSGTKPPPEDRYDLIDCNIVQSICELLKN